MKHIKLAHLFLALVLTFVTVGTIRAQGPQGHTFGFGLTIGEPLGGSIKAWMNNVNAFVATIGTSYFGSPRVGGDYLWHFNAFNSSVVKMYAGPGLALGFGRNGYIFYREDKNKFYYRADNSVGIAGRAIFGLNIIPHNTPLEFFIEAGPLVGFSPGFGTAFDAAAGVRFYP